MAQKNTTRVATPKKTTTTKVGPINDNVADDDGDVDDVIDGDGDGEDDVPVKKVVTTSSYSQHPWGIFFTILGTVLLDFDADACQSPSRDQYYKTYLCPSQQ